MNSKKTLFSSFILPSNYTQVPGSSVATEDETARDLLTTSFPSLNVVAAEDDGDVGFFSFGGFMAGWEAPSIGR